MNRTVIERLKNYTILILFIMSIIQVGILWDVQNHGLPISFLSGLFNKQVMVPSINAAEAARSRYFLPEEVIVSEGFNDDIYHILDKNQEDFIKVWSIGREYLKEILTSTTVEAEPKLMSTNENLPQIFAKTAIIYDFKMELPRELISWFSSSNVTANSNFPSKISKIVICPLDDVNVGINTVYLINQDTIYKYSVVIKDSRLNKNTVLGIINKYAKEENAREFRSIKYIGALTFKTSTDLLLSVGRGNSSRIKNIISETPEFLRTEDIDSIEEIVLGNEKVSYYKNRLKDNSIEFKNYNNSYTISPEGVLEYKYLQNEKEQTTNKNNVAWAFENAVKFIDGIKVLTPGADLRLTDIKESAEDQTFELTFDYLVNGMRVFYNDKNSSIQKDAYKNAIKIKVNNKRVLSCIWTLRKFSPSKEKRYNVNHMTLIDSLPKELGVAYNDSFSIKEIIMGYRLNTSITRQESSPVWRITTLDGKEYPINVKEMESK